MLEILGIILLCNANKRNAISRGRKPGVFIAFTILLWVGLEFVGIFVGFYLGSTGLAYLFGICFALLGGLISWLIAKNCRRGDYVSPQDAMLRDISSRAEKLAVPAVINISMAHTSGRYNFYLNGQLIGDMRKGQTLSALTDYRQNVIQAQDVFGTIAMAAYPFNVENGIHAQISFTSGMFQPGFGIFPLGLPVEMPPNIRFCPACGQCAAIDAQYCARCGTVI